MKYTCPISHNTIDHNVIRLVGLFTLILMIISYFNLFGEYSDYIMLFLAIDFLMRIFVHKLSILKFTASTILHQILRIKPQEIGMAPKKFAAGIGALFSILIFEFSFFIDNSGIKFTYMLLNLIFVFAVSLETFFSFCLGCKIYSYIQFFKSKLK